MKKIILSNILFLLTFSFASAQLVFEPGCLDIEADEIETFLTEIFITNEGSESEAVYWTFEKAADFPEDWKFQICDINLCYNWDVSMSSTSNFLVNHIAPGETVLFTMKVENVANVEGSEEVKFPISGASSGKMRLFNNADFVDAIAETSCLVSNNNSVTIEDLVIYPNPTTDMFQIKNDANVATVSIYNIVGRQISSLNHTEGMVHDVSNLRAGMYLVRLKNNDGEVVKAMRLSKR